jgi:hypothetical protein
MSNIVRSRDMSASLNSNIYSAKKTYKKRSKGSTFEYSKALHGLNNSTSSKNLLSKSNISHTKGKSYFW